MVELVLNISSRPNGLPGMVKALGEVMFQNKLERGCLDCRLYAETGNPQSLRYVEQWSTPQDLDSQLRSQRFGMLLAIMETAPEPPDLEVRTISEQRGLEYVRSIRLASLGLASATEGCAVGVSNPPSQRNRPPSISQ